MIYDRTLIPRMSNAELSDILPRPFTGDLHSEAAWLDYMEYESWKDEIRERIRKQK